MTPVVLAVLVALERPVVLVAQERPVVLVALVVWPSARLSCRPQQSYRWTSPKAATRDVELLLNALSTPAYARDSKSVTEAVLWLPA